MVHLLHISVQLEVSSFVSDCEVAASHFGLGGVKGHLVSGEPALVSQHRRAVDGRTGEVKIHITAHVHIFTLIGRLHLTTLLTVNTDKPQRSPHLKHVAFTVNHPTQCLGRRSCQRSASVLWWSEKHKKILLTNNWEYSFLFSQANCHYSLNKH